MFSSVLIANRGEIAVRIAATCRRLGVRSIGLHTPADAGSLHVRVVDESVALPADDSYLDPEAVVAAAVAAGADAVHPGYGFLAENPSLARACEAVEDGLAFVGPSPEVIELMGDKVAARAAAAAAGLPVLPGRSEPGLTDDDLRSAAHELGFPVLIKPAAGGGGKGMHVVGSVQQLDEALSLARSEARAAFGDDSLFLERYLSVARHIEVQVLADASGNVVHLGERECTLQRRHQKVIEEAPAAALPAQQREAMCEAAVRLARSSGYVGVGTVEMILDRSSPGWFFLEMNTRLQVEHRVTELVWGVDLVELQLRVAAGETINLSQNDLRPSGHAVEARLYAEDPMRGFLPTGGTVLALRLPSPTGGLAGSTAQHSTPVEADPVRVGFPSPPTDPIVVVDSAIEAGDRVGSEYDPLLVKIVVWAPEREPAISRLASELAGSMLLGVVTNQELLLRLLWQPPVYLGLPVDTRFVERIATQMSEEPEHPEVEEKALAAAALALLLARPSGGNRAWDDAGGWRVGGAAWTTTTLRSLARGETGVGLRGDATAGHFVGDVRLGAATVRRAVADLSGHAARHASLVLFLDLSLDGRRTRYDVALEADRAWVARDGTTTVLGFGRSAREAATGDPGSGFVRSPMPGVVRRLDVAAGATVRRGETLAVVEAMKMQHPVNAPVDGTVLEVRVGEGSRVELDQVLAVVGEATDVGGDGRPGVGGDGAPDVDGGPGRMEGR